VVWVRALLPSSWSLRRAAAALSTTYLLVLSPVRPSYALLRDFPDEADDGQRGHR